jgi:hypothetical protein
VVRIQQSTDSTPMLVGGASCWDSLPLRKMLGGNWGLFEKVTRDCGFACWTHESQYGPQNKWFTKLATGQVVPKSVAMRWNLSPVLRLALEQQQTCLIEPSSSSSSSATCSEQHCWLMGDRPCNTVSFGAHTTRAQDRGWLTR